jgi:hypothetical protein
MNTNREDSARRDLNLSSSTSEKPAPILRSSAKSLNETARIKIPIRIERTKRLAELTPDDIPPGFAPEDVAIDSE